MKLTGIDFEDNVVRIAVICKRDGEIALESSYKIEGNTPENLYKNVGLLLRNKKIPTENLFVSCSDLHSNYLHLKIPPINKNQLKKYLINKIAVERKLNEKDIELTFAIKPINTSSKEKQSMVNDEIFIYYLNREEIVHKLNQLTKYEIYPTVLLSREIGLWNFFEYFSSENLDQPTNQRQLLQTPDQTSVLKNSSIAVMNIGEEIIDILIFNNNSPVFYRKIPEGVNKVISSFSKEINVEMGIVRDIFFGNTNNHKDALTNSSISAPPSTFTLSHPSTETSKLEVDLNIELNKFVKDINMTFIYFSRQKNSFIKNVFYTGTGSMSNKLKTCLNRINYPKYSVIEIEKSRVSFKIPQSKEDLLPEFAIACGLALNSLTYKSKLNFIPKTFTNKYLLKRKFKNQLLLSSAILVAVFILHFFIRNSLFLPLKSELQTMKEQAEALKKIEILNAKFEVKKNIITRRINFINYVRGEKINFFYLLKQISESMPDEIYLLKMDMVKVDNSNLKINLFCSLYEPQKNLNQVSRFISNLKNLNLYYSIVHSLPNYIKLNGENSKYEFNLVLSMRVGQKKQ